MTTTTTSPGLGIAPPSPSVPPETIFQSSTAEDVKLWVYHFIRQSQPYINSDDAWAIAREVKGQGALVLQYSKEDWDKEVPNWGHLIYIKLHQTPKYVIDTVFEILLVIQAIFLFVAGGSTVYTLVTKSNLAVTKTIGIVFTAYTFTLRTIQSILSSQWAHQWNRYPDALKLRRSGDSFCKDFAGIPK